MAVSSANALKSLFLVLGCVMLTTLIYTISIDGLPFRKDLLTPWMAATLVDFYINVVPLAAWVCYKESNWISAILWVILLVCFGSITTCAYILMQFLKLSSQESLQDPMYHVLLRHSNKDGVEEKRKHSGVVIARIIFSALGCLMLATLIYTLITGGSFFRKELFTLWMVATLVDFLINVVALSVWVTYKESNWISAFLWIILLMPFGSIITCAYIVQHLLQLTSQDPVYLVLLNGGHRWMATTLIDVFINLVPILAWVCDKESKWISAIVWVILILCFGSIATCAYIFMQFLKLSSQESLRDPIYHVLLRHSNKDGVEEKRKHSGVVIARIIFSALGCLMLAALIFSFIIDGSFFREEIFTPWMVTSLVDFFINVADISVWDAYKESNWISAFLWIILLTLVGSTMTCVYMVLHLLQLTSQDPVYLVLLNSGNRKQE